MSEECQSKRSHIEGVPEQENLLEELSEQEEPPEELLEHIRARGAIDGPREANRAIYASDNIIGSLSGAIGIKTHICLY